MGLRIISHLLSAPFFIDRSSYMQKNVVSIIIQYTYKYKSLAVTSIII